jgi:hypothetical protein
LFPTQLWELLYTYHVIKQCTEKETTSLSNFLLTVNPETDKIKIKISGDRSKVSRISNLLANPFFRK